MSDLQFRQLPALWARIGGTRAARSETIPFRSGRRMGRVR